jgi:hypothetical protein
MKNLLKAIQSYFSKTFVKSVKADNSGVDLDKLLKAKDPKETNTSIIELDNHICKLCAWGDELDKLNANQKAFYYNQELEREVNNGGFNLFYSNSSGNYAHEVVDSLNAIGANKTAGIVKKANDQFPNGRVPKDRDERQQILEQIRGKANEIWENLNQDFYKYEDDLNSLNLDFIKRNINDFR